MANRPVHVALAVTVDGTRDILGLWAGDGGAGAKYRRQVLTEIKNRGVEEVCMIVCGELKGLPDSISAVRPQAVAQTCVVHLIRRCWCAGTARSCASCMHRSTGNSRV